MTWFKVDDTFYAHPKVVDLEGGPCCYEALSLWVLAGSWSAGQLTNGEIPSSLVRKLGFKQRAADELIRVGLWSKSAEVYLFHDWAKYQPTREEIEDKRRATKDRVTRHRNAARNGVTNASRNEPSNGVSNPSPVPSRPDLDPPKPPEGGGARAAPETPEGGTTAQLVADAVRAAARARNISPTPFVSRPDLQLAARRVEEAVQDGTASDALAAATALVEAAFALGEGPRQRPLRFALLEATIAPNGRSAAQAQHVPPGDPWV